MIDKFKDTAKRKTASDTLAKLLDASKALDAFYGSLHAQLSPEARARVLHGIRVNKLLMRDLEESLKVEEPVVAQ